ncbi:VOC family protein [Halonotius sp. F2-221B]|uniref:VOC family protein n=1 Tax=Halonotius sp. F2-221B TaxID=2731620 RepID=UPI00398B2748
MTIDVVDIDHVAIRVRDLDESLRFYRDLLGLETRDRDRFEDGGVPFVAVVAGGRHIHLVPTDSDMDVGGEHICLLVRSDTVNTREEIDALIDEIEAAGYTVEAGEPYERYGAYGNDWAIYVRDPDGRRVELKLH